MTDTRRTFNGTIPECDFEATALPRTDACIRGLVDQIYELEQEIRRQQRINRMLCLVIEDQAIKVTVKGVEG